MAATRCLNCGSDMRGSVCSSCGQKEAEPISLRRLAEELKDQLLGLDYRVLRTARELLVSPGKMVQNYLKGRRIPYTNPLKSLFLAATLYLLVITVFDVQVNLAGESQEAARAVSALMNYLVYLFLIPTAWLLKVLFRRSGYNWAESYVAVCYLWSGYLLIAALLGLVMVTLDEWYFPVRSAVGWAYLVYGLKGLYRGGWWEAIWKGSLFFAGYFLATGIVMGVLISLSYAVGFEPLQIPLGRGSGLSGGSGAEL